MLLTQKIEPTPALWAMKQSRFQQCRLKLYRSLLESFPNDGRMNDAVLASSTLQVFSVGADAVALLCPPASLSNRRVTHHSYAPSKVPAQFC